MNTKRYILYANILNFCMIELVSVTFIWFLAAELGFPLTIWTPLSLAVLLIFSYMTRCYIRRLIVFALLHLLMLAFTIIVPQPILDRSMAIVFAVLWLIFDMVYWGTPGKKGISMLPAWVVIVFLVVFVRATQIGFPFLANEAYIGGMIFIGLFFLRLYCMNTKQFLEDGQMHDHVPIVEMLHQNGKMVLLMITCFVVGMISLYSEVIAEELLELFKKLLMFLLWALYWLLTKLFPDKEAEGSAMDALTLPQAQQANPWLEKILMFIEIILRWAFVAAAIYLLIRAIYHFYKQYRYRQLQAEKEVVYEGYKETKTWITRKRREQREGSSRNMTNAQKVRRIYRKRVENAVKRGYLLHRFQTPRERAEDLLVWNSKEDCRQLTDIYEKARYSTGDLSNEEVRLAKN